MWISFANFLACSLLPLCGLGLFLLLLADNWHVQTRVKLGFIFVIALALAILALH